MTANQNSYCLDANVLIEAWQKYYSPQLCPSYWELLSQLGVQKKIFIPDAVYIEIVRTEDGLSQWLKQSQITVQKIDGAISECLRKIYAANPSHQYIVANGGQHSAADPWVIAHAMNAGAVVVTKEHKDVFTKPTKIKIPHICDNMGIRWINDFEFVTELNIRFTCTFEKI
ncbi:MAG: hypothetical protein JWR72_3295 [Flavisolibacter sp.]|nr:hypothetical protein [Flavisolibacter sp.]